MLASTPTQKLRYISLSFFTAAVREKWYASFCRSSGF